MTTTRTTIASVLGALCMGALAGCNKGTAPATEVPAAAADATQTPSAGEECLHTEGCCGGHTEGDGSCGADEAGTGKEGLASTSAGAKEETAAEPQRFQWTIEPGKFAEINVELGAGAKMSASFRSEAAVAWNIHSHEGDKPTIHAEGDDAEGAPAFAAEKGGLYSYLWVNEGKKAAKLDVELRIEGTGRVHSTHPE